MGRNRFANSSAARNGAESTAFPGQKDPRAMTPGGPKAKALVENVIAALEQGLSISGFDRAAHLEALKPQLDVLIKMSEDMAAAMKSQVHICDQARAQALQKIGDCVVKKQALVERLAETNAEIARDTVAAEEDKKTIQAIEGEMKEIRRKIAENFVEGLTWDTVLSLFGVKDVGQELADLKNDVVGLRARRDQVYSKLKSTQERLSSMEADVRDLGSQKSAMECEVDNLNEAIQLFDRKSKAYARRLADFHEATMFYRLLSNETENLHGSLGLPRIVERLLESKELVLITGDQAGQQKQSTLKELLIHLGGEYDLYLENGLPQINDGVVGASRGFQWPKSKL